MVGTGKFHHQQCNQAEEIAVKCFFQGENNENRLEIRTYNSVIIDLISKTLNRFSRHFVECL